MESNRQMKSSWLAKQLLEIFKARPHWPAKEIMDTVRKGYKVLIKRALAYKVKYRAHRLLHGSMVDHYGKLGRYIAAIKASCPDTVIQLVHAPARKNEKVPIPTVRRGWIEGCRKFLSIDACFLKTFLGGQLLAATGRDGNDQMYPVAWAIVEGGNNSSWEWFMTQLQHSLNLGEGDDLIVLSDEHLTIISYVPKILPKCEHKHCARHIFAHWHKDFKGDEMKLMFWKAAKAYSVVDFNEAMEEMSEVNSDAADAFRKHNLDVFCRAFLKTASKTDVIISNLSETFNGYIINTRTKYLIYMLEDIRITLTQRLVVKRQEMEASSAKLCPRIQARLEKEKNLAANCTPIPSTNIIFQVNYHMDSVTVDLEARSCTCRKWDLTGIPYCHVVASIFFSREDDEDFVDPVYTRENYLRSYAGSIPSLVSERHCPLVTSPLIPPPIKVGHGRPKISRRKDPHENPKKPGRLTKHGVEMTCTICKVKGDNKRTCPNKDKAPSHPPHKKAKTSDASTQHGAQMILTWMQRQSQAKLEKEEGSLGEGRVQEEERELQMLIQAAQTHIQA
ncbi:uncharacterized protein LOC125493548 [Beta vulgaris subsp. vulgaris]|uniref:uncharacterized protein LOC125493548 n=1 Tax=Beta vulgaris subsp. vulgaris TaxID=3555 RepID=UPI00254857FE|nr:uncharacterized protein LOC125493548 [Beta vulgaris subsp. vulgaris]